MEVHKKFPRREDAILKKNLREYKYIAYQMNQYNRL